MSINDVSWRSHGAAGWAQVQELGVVNISDECLFGQREVLWRGQCSVDESYRTEAVPDRLRCALWANAAVRAKTNTNCIIYLNVFWWRWE